MMALKRERHPMAEIILENVSKRFGSVSVVENVSLTVLDGEFVVFLGPSGSGKTTLLRMIAGLETIDAGTLTIGGKRCETLPPGQRNVAMVFQNYALYPHMNVQQNMAFGLQNVGMPARDIEKRVRDAARILEIEALLARKPSQLSGGQRQRVAIGRAIVKEPKAFLFDEPLSNLDAALRVRTRVELAELHQRMKSTMVYVTHDQTEAMTLADRIVVLNDRRIEQIGTPMEVYSKPASRFVAGFVGSPAMNFIKVNVSGGGKTVNVSTHDGTKLPKPAAVVSSGSYELGIRPESLRVIAKGGTARGQVKVVERLGDRTLVYARMADGSLLTAQADGNSSVQPNQTVGLDFDMTQSHFFDAAGKAYHAA
jgi:multiple sugar transport system ATP-binding protein